MTRRSGLTRLLAVPLACLLVSGAVDAIPAGAASTTWTTQASKPGTVLPWAVSCATRAVCTAVGGGVQDNDPVILRTTDRGRSWTRQTPPAGVGGLSAVSCPTVQFCLATGTGFHAIYSVTTTDGGATWSVAGFLGGEDWFDVVDCVSAADCYAEGADFGAALFHSTDGGADWSQAMLPDQGSSLSSVTRADLSCPTATTCFLVRPNLDIAGEFAVYKSDDSGGTVTLLRHVTGGSTVPDSISCWSATSCMVGGAGNGTRVLVTSDGGTRWSSLALPAGARDGVGVQCPAPSSCVLAATSSSGYLAATTSNAGASWSTAPIADVPASEPDSFGMLRCPTATACMVELPSAPSFALYATADGARSWTSSPLPFGRPPLDWVQCPSSRHCAAVGPGYAMWSIDGGRTWYPSTRAPPASVSVDALACATALTCVAGGEAWDPRTQEPVGALYRSTNGGRSWNRVTLAEASFNVTTVACPTAATCVAATSGPSPGFVRSTDGGLTWSDAVAPGSSGFETPSVSCGTATTCRSVGSRSGSGAGVVLSSSDAGATWTSAVFPSGVGGVDLLDCTSATVCVASGADEDFGYSVELDTTTTDDGGATWSTPVNLGNGSYPRSLACEGATCQLVWWRYNYGAPSTTVLETSTDGATSWTVDGVPPQVLAIAAVALAPALGFVAVGTDATDGPIALSTP